MVCDPPRCSISVTWLREELRELAERASERVLAPVEQVDAQRPDAQSNRQYACIHGVQIVFDTPAAWYLSHIVSKAASSTKHKGSVHAKKGNGKSKSSVAVTFLQ